VFAVSGPPLPSSSFIPSLTSWFLAIAPYSGPVFVRDIAERLEGGKLNSADEATDGSDVFVAHMHPSGCTSMVSMMKSLVTGFLHASPSRDKSRYLPSHCHVTDRERSQSYESRQPHWLVTI